MTRKSDRERLVHMLEAANDALNFVAGCSFDDFAQDRMRQHAVIHAVEIIGEAGAHVTQEYRSAHSEIPWRDIINMRNHLIHAYFDIDIPLTWKTVMEDLPPFISILKELLKEEGSFQYRLPEP